MDEDMPARRTEESAEWKDTLSMMLKGKRLVEDVKDPSLREQSPGDKPAVKNDVAYESMLYKPYRIIKPRTAVTMDYRPDRLNLIVNKDMVITEVGFY
ncbi:hypothetical protein EV182_004150 [Spiromyces aspiralis]|uniref:Uncharacterized protein n=1 Tax=Spiromyces aspiralis TaxID=68401 RepID=A0ACC1HPF6_9FUNG|nr:hypothetical protein EV182_004150 [Spiromyces aspiralis]